MLKNIKLIDFKDLNFEEKEMILLWRNNPSVKKWMFNSKEISRENHFDFLKNLKYKKDKLYFLVKDDKHYIGVISFININDKSSEIGIYSNPKINGVGTILLQTIISYGFDILNIQKLIAEVFSENLKALNLYTKHNFSSVSKKQFNNKELIQMELENENR